MSDETTPNRQAISRMIRAEPYHRLLFTFNELMSEGFQSCTSWFGREQGHPWASWCFCDSTILPPGTLPGCRLIATSDGITGAVPAPRFRLYGLIVELFPSDQGHPLRANGLPGNGLSLM